MVGFGARKRWLLLRAQSTIVLINLILTGILASPLFAKGAITGNVRDSTGAVLEGQEIVFTQTATHQKTRVTSNRDGDFGPLELPAGKYRLDIRAKCYRRYSKAVHVLGEPIRIQVVLILSCPEDRGPVRQTPLQA